MEEVLNQLQSTAISQNASDDSKTSFEGLYKNWGRLSRQEERRRETLEVQKSNRNTKLDKFRGILELVNAVEETEIFKTHNKAYYRPSIYVAGFNRAPTYSQVLMMSEWMIEKPVDFAENWLVVPCPKGMRTLLVASNGRTKIFTKYGHFLFECRTALPGGNPCDRKSKKCCVLDCFYQKQLNTLFVLDILAWNSQPMTDGELEFRHYWLTMQLSELPGLKVINKKNEIVFSILPKAPCMPESFNKFMMTFPHFDSDVAGMDGLLFYHKKAHYFAGETPLVGWLYPFMVPELLGEDIPIHKAYLLEKPSDYTNQTEFIKQFEDKQDKKESKRKSRNSRRNSEMDTSDVTQKETKTPRTKPNPESNDKSKGETMEAEVASEAKSKPSTDNSNNETMDTETAPKSQSEENSKTETMAAELEPDAADETIQLTDVMDEETAKEIESKD